MDDISCLDPCGRSSPALGDSGGASEQARLTITRDDDPFAGEVILGTPRVRCLHDRGSSPGGSSVNERKGNGD